MFHFVLDLIHQHCSSSSGGYQFINQGILYLQILLYVFYYS